MMRILIITILLFATKYTYAQDFNLSLEQKNFLNLVKNFDSDMNYIKYLYGDEVYKIGIEMIIKNDCSSVSLLEKKFKTDLNIKMYVADILIQGICVKQNIKTGFELIHDLADNKNYGPAHHYLYKAYKYGSVNNVQLTNINLKKYYYYLEKASHHNVAEAKHDYAIELLSLKNNIQNENKSIELLINAARDKDVLSSKKSYLALIEYFLQKHMLVLQNTNNIKNINYNYLEQAIFYGRECANAGYNVCMMYMPVLLVDKNYPEDYEKRITEAYSWIILSKNFYIDEKIKHIANQIENDFLLENYISNEIKSKALSLAIKWVPDGMFRYIN